MNFKDEELLAVYARYQEHLLRTGYTTPKAVSGSPAIGCSGSSKNKGGTSQSLRRWAWPRNHALRWKLRDVPPKTDNGRSG